MTFKTLIFAITSLLRFTAAMEEGRVRIYTHTRVITEWTTVVCSTTTAQTESKRTATELDQQSETTSTPGPPTSGSKRGVAYNKAELTSHFLRSDKISWAWNWDSAANGLGPGIEFVPSLWSPIDSHTSRWFENANAAISKGSTHLLSFNECDRADQCNLSAEAAAEAHIKYMNPFTDRARISSPSVSNSNVDGEGLDWLEKWVSICESRGCKYHFCNIHWYSSLGAADSLYTHIREASRICGGKPVWLTEFAPVYDSGEQAVPADASVWLESVLPVLDNLIELERYSYFMVAKGILVDNLGLTISGTTYLE
jgi:hypothetical protein